MKKFSAVHCFILHTRIRIPIITKALCYDIFRNYFEESIMFKVLSLEKFFIIADEKSDRNMGEQNVDRSPEKSKIETKESYRSHTKYYY